MKPGALRRKQIEGADDDEMNRKLSEFLLGWSAGAGGAFSGGEEGEGEEEGGGAMLSSSPSHEESAK